MLAPSDAAPPAPSDSPPGAPTPPQTTADIPRTATGVLAARRKSKKAMFCDLRRDPPLPPLQLVLPLDLTNGRSVPIGSVITVEGEPGVTDRGEASLFVSTLTVVGVAPPPAAGAQLRVLPPAALTPPRFVIAPTTVRWQSELKQLHIRCENSLDWRGAPPLPPPPAPRCWLLPATDAVALSIARHRVALAALGWRLLTCDEAAVRRLSDKAEFHSTAVALGLAAHLPTHYSSAADASYPCILKGAEGEHGRAVRIVQSAGEATERTARAVADGDGDRWLLQEQYEGRSSTRRRCWWRRGRWSRWCAFGTSTTRRVRVAAQCQRAQGAAVCGRGGAGAPQVMAALVKDYTGVCNFNYKLRDADGSLAILECNTRVGGDLAADAPRKAAKEFFEALDATPPSPPPPDDIAAPPPPPPPRRRR